MTIVLHLRLLTTVLCYRSSRQIISRREALMDDFLRSSNSKTSGLFLDIVLPDYNPTVAHRRVVARCVLTSHPLNILFQEA